MPYLFRGASLWAARLAIVPLGKAGMALDRGWTLYVDQHALVAFHYDPWPAVRKALSYGSAAIHVANIASTRASMHEATTIDWALTLSYPAATNEAQRGMLKAIHAGALITPKELFKAQVVESPKCTGCDHPVCDLWHIMWECPCYHDTRTRLMSQHASIDVKQLPRSLSLHGLAPCLSAGGCSDQSYQPSSLREQEWYHEYMPQHLAMHATVACVARHMRGAIPHHPAPDVGSVHGELPSEVNVYTDGSVMASAGGLIQLAGAGVWIRPSVRQSCQVQHSELVKFAYGNPSGQTFYAPMGGSGATSTRAETLALAMALTIPAPIRVATDSKALMYAFSRLLSLRACANCLNPDVEHLRRAFFCDRPDGDLWLIIAQLIHTRGPRTVSLKKVPAHTSEEAITRGLITQQDRQGNDSADAAARQGAEFGQSPLQEWRTVTTKRREQFASLVRAIQSTQVAVLLGSSQRLALL